MEELLLAPRTGGLQLAEEFFTTLRKYELRQVCVQRASEAREPKVNRFACTARTVGLRNETRYLSPRYGRPAQRPHS